jgi:predicted regulator of Ras-like GTPase activity (Roadblock/LC7/MglB family)
MNLVLEKLSILALGISASMVAYADGWVIAATSPSIQLQ